MSRFTLMLFTLGCIVGSIFALGGRDKEEVPSLVLESVVGLVTVYGNEPHTWLGFTDQQGVAYKLEASPLILEELQNLQGVLLEILGTIENNDENNTGGFQSLSGGILRVQKYTLCKSPQ